MNVVHARSHARAFGMAFGCPGVVRSARLRSRPPPSISSMVARASRHSWPASEPRANRAIGVMTTRSDTSDLHYETHVFCCVNQRAPDHPRSCCSARGSRPLRDYMKSRAKELGLEKTRINMAGCLERCELGPTMVIYPEGIWYTYDSREDVDEILERHLLGGKRVERLLLEPGQIFPKPKVRQQLKLAVSGIERLTLEIRRFELVSAEGGGLPPFEAGAHIDVFTGNGLRRSYSLANDPEERHRYVIGVLREENGSGGSCWMHDKLAVGDVVSAMPPLNNFALVEDARRHVLIAGGIGITPILAMGYRLSRIAADVTLHYCTKSREETAFLDEVERGKRRDSPRWRRSIEGDRSRCDAGRARRGRPPLHLRPERAAPGGPQASLALAGRDGSLRAVRSPRRAGGLGKR